MGLLTEARKAEREKLKVATEKKEETSKLQRVIDALDDEALKGIGITREGAGKLQTFDELEGVLDINKASKTTDKKITSPDIKLLQAIETAGKKPSFISKIQAALSPSAFTPIEKAREKVGDISPELLEQFKAQFGIEIPSVEKTAEEKPLTDKQKDLIGQYKKRYPDRTEDEILEAMKAGGLL